MDKLILGDCFEKLNEIEDNSVNLVITSPPYNVDLGNNKFNKFSYNEYKDNKEHKEYIDWLKSIFEKIYTKLKNDGRVCINIGDGRNGSIPTHSDIIQFMKEIGYNPYSTIIWNKNTVSNRTAWGSWLSPSSPSYPSPFEYILIFYKNCKKLIHKGETDLTKEEFTTYAYGLWTFAPEKNLKKLGHPVVFPVELPHRLIKMNSYKGDVVLDPFMGSGTVGLVCKQLERDFIGIELNKDYFELAISRITEK